MSRGVSRRWRAVAQELLLADEVESVFDDDDDPQTPTSWALWVVLGTIVALAATLFARSV